MHLIGSGGTLVVPPRPGNWTEVLPEPFDTDPEVVVVLVPGEALSAVHETADGVRLGVLKTKTALRGLQVLEPKMGAWPEHQQVFAEHNIEMMAPSYIGPLSECPQNLLLSTTRYPLVFEKAFMSRQYLNLRAYLADQYVDDETGLRDPLN